MVTINGLSRNMGHDMLIDREGQYRNLVDNTVIRQEQFVSSLKTGCRRYDCHHYYSKHWKHDTWLRLMGLMETWDVI